MPAVLVQHASAANEHQARHMDMCQTYKTDTEPAAHSW